jgi:hypothetical protein
MFDFWQRNRKSKICLGSIDICPKCGSMLWKHKMPTFTLCVHHINGGQYNLEGDKNCDFGFKGQPLELDLYEGRKALWFYNLEGFLFAEILIVDGSKYSWINEKDMGKIYERLLTYSGLSPKFPNRI